MTMAPGHSRPAEARYAVRGKVTCDKMSRARTPEAEGSLLCADLLCVGTNASRKRQALGRVSGRRADRRRGRSAREWVRPYEGESRKAVPPRMGASGWSNRSREGAISTIFAEIHPPRLRSLTCFAHGKIVGHEQIRQSVLFLQVPRTDLGSAPEPIRRARIQVFHQNHELVAAARKRSGDSGHRWPLAPPESSRGFSIRRAHCRPRPTSSSRSITRFFCSALDPRWLTRNGFGQQHLDRPAGIQ